MKIIVILFAIACAGAAHALPSGEEPHTDTKQVTVDIDKLRADLEAKFSDTKFLNEKFGTQPSNNNFKTGLSEPSNHNTEITVAVDNNEHVNIGGIGKWMKYVPWGTLLDVVVEAVKKATE